MSFWLRVLLFWPFVTYAKEHQRDLFPEGFPKALAEWYDEQMATK